MNKSAFQTYMYEHIPITEAMAFEVMEYTQEKIAIKAHLEVNINHKSTAFGGSVSSLLIMTGWGKIRMICDDFPNVPQIVIQKSEVQYLKAIHQDFVATVYDLSAEEIEKFKATYLKFGKARITIHTFIEVEGFICAKGIGQYVILN